MIRTAAAALSRICAVVSGYSELDEQIRKLERLRDAYAAENQAPAPRSHEPDVKNRGRAVLRTDAMSI